MASKFFKQEKKIMNISNKMLVGYVLLRTLTKKVPCKMLAPRIFLPSNLLKTISG